MTRYILLALLLGVTAAHADESLSDSETSFTGAVMLEGDVDVTLGGVEMGMYEDGDMSRYAFFAGNTMYAGVEDDYGNTVDAIIEFFWFESSIDRGSDFYVAVCKIRTSPNTDDWELVSQDDPVVYLYADTDISVGTGAFRWDWSVPFDSYGIDSFGEATLKTEYGIGLNAEGALLSAETEEEDGSKVSGTVQVKGYVDNEFKVQSQYQISLYNWEVLVHGSPGSMEWELLLNNGLQDDQSAYHEFFLAMQSEEGEPFVIDWLELGGVVQDDWWWWDESYMDVAITDVTLTRPEDFEDGDDDDDDDDGHEEEGDETGDDDDDDVDGNEGDGDGDELTLEGEGRKNLLGDDEQAVACNMGSGAPAPAGTFLAAVMLAYALLRRRIA